jgi:hypothetical protein
MKAFLTTLAVFFGLTAASFAANPAPPPPNGSPMGVGSGDMRGPGGAPPPSSNTTLPNTPPPPPEAHTPDFTDKDMSKSPAWGDTHDAPPPDEMNDNDGEGNDDHMVPPPPPKDGKGKDDKDGKAPPPPHDGMGDGHPPKFDPKKLNPPDSPENPGEED